MYIAIAGNIGSGKTTLTKMLSNIMDGNSTWSPWLKTPISMTITRISRDGLSIWRCSI